MRLKEGEGPKPVPLRRERQAMEKTAVQKKFGYLHRLLPCCQKLVIPVNYSGKAFAQMLA